MIESLLVALIYIAILAVVGWVVAMLLAKAGAPAIAANIVWVVVALMALLVLLRVVLGGDLTIDQLD